VSPDTRAARRARRQALTQLTACRSCRRRPGRLVVLSDQAPPVWSCRACAGLPPAPRRRRTGYPVTPNDIHTSAEEA
jgi:hypothetical protein